MYGSSGAEDFVHYQLRLVHDTTSSLRTGGNSFETRPAVHRRPCRQLPWSVHPLGWRDEFMLKAPRIVVNGVRVALSKIW